MSLYPAPEESGFYGHVDKSVGPQFDFLPCYCGFSMHKMEGNPVSHGPYGMQSKDLPYLSFNVRIHSIGGIVPDRTSLPYELGNRDFKFHGAENKQIY